MFGPIFQREFLTVPRRVRHYVCAGRLSRSALGHRHHGLVGDRRLDALGHARRTLSLRPVALPSSDDGAAGDLPVLRRPVVGQLHLARKRPPHVHPAAHDRHEQFRDRAGQAVRQPVADRPAAAGDGAALDVHHPPRRRVAGTGDRGGRHHGGDGPGRRVARQSRRPVARADFPGAGPDDAVPRPVSLPGTRPRRAAELGSAGSIRSGRCRASSLRRNRWKRGFLRPSVSPR